MTGRGAVAIVALNVESPGVSLGGAPGRGEAAVAGALTVHVSVVDEGEHALGARGCRAGRFGRGRHGLRGTTGGTVAPGTHNMVAV